MFCTGDALSVLEINFVQTSIDLLSNPTTTWSLEK